MKIIFRLLIVGFVLLMIMNCVSYQQTNQIPARDWLVSAERTFHKLINKNSFSATETVKISTWTDAKGVVHYENRAVEGAKTINVDPNINVLPPAPVVKLPEAKEEKPKTTNEEIQALQKAKDAYAESLINN